MLQHFWIQHLRYIQIVKLFIQAERTGNWNLHLVALSHMINIFAATGHINYTKSARLHLQNMMELPSKYQWVYKYMQTVHNMATTQSEWLVGTGQACGPNW